MGIFIHDDLEWSEAIDLLTDCLHPDVADYKLITRCDMQLELSVDVGGNSVCCTFHDDCHSDQGIAVGVGYGSGDSTVFLA